jgi:dihydrofolate reductase
MARKIIIYIASSLNSKIADQDGAVEWLEKIPHPDGEDYGYQHFYETIDTTIMGYSTFAQLKGWDIPFPYKGKKNFVVTRKDNLEADPDVDFINKDPLAFFSSLKQQKGRNIWLVGGGAVNKLFLNAGLVDELIIHIMPVILNGGIDIFSGLPEEKWLKLLSSKSYESGVVELHYAVEKSNPALRG